MPELAARWLMPAWRRIGSFITHPQARAMVSFGIMPAVTEVEVRGVRLRCHIGDNFSETNIALCGDGNNSPELDQFLPRLRAGDVVADIGANCGLYSLLASRLVGDRGKVLAVEPNPVLIDRLRINIDLSHAGNVVVLPFALGIEDGTATMYVKDKQLGMSGMARTAKRRPMQIPTRSIGSVLSELAIDRVDAIKIDVEGFEDRVLAPYLAEIVDDCLPHTVLMETFWSRRWKADLLSLFWRRGYRTAWRSGMNILLVRGDAA